MPGRVEKDQVVAATRPLPASDVRGRMLAPEDGPLAGWFRGPEVFDGTYGLTPAQQHQARNQAVWPPSGNQRRPRGDRGAGGRSSDPGAPLGTAEGSDAHRLAARGGGPDARRPLAVVPGKVRRLRGE